VKIHSQIEQRPEEHVAANAADQVEIQSLHAVAPRSQRELI
jgi:hypothetical protein